MHPETLQNLFEKITQTSAEAVVYAPGRVNLIGEHTDYNDGYVLPAAIDQGVGLAGRRIEGSVIRLHAVDLQRTCSFSVEHPEKDPAEPWADYFKGVVWALFIRGFSIPACEVVVTGNVPQGSGLSSSAAYEVASVLLLKTLGGFDLSSLESAKVGREAENGFVGVACGIMDQLASACGEESRALLIDCRTLAREMVEIPRGLRIVVVDSGVKHSLASSEYNQRRAECEEAVKSLSVFLKGIKALRDVSIEDLARLEKTLSPIARKRARHVVTENARVLSMVSALKADDRSRMRALMLESHTSLRDDYEVSCSELNVLVEIACSIPTCHGSRLTGAGFGGCTVNLVEAGEVDPFKRLMLSTYWDRTGREGQVHVFSPSQGARVLFSDEALK